MNVWRTLPSTGGVHFNSTYRTAVPSATSVTARAPLVPERLASTRRSKNDNTPRPLDQWTNSPFIGQRVGNCKCFTLTHYLADLFAMHRGPRSIPFTLGNRYGFWPQTGCVTVPGCEAVFLVARQRFPYRSRFNFFGQKHGKYATVQWNLRHNAYRFQ